MLPVLPLFHQNFPHSKTFFCRFLPVMWDNYSQWLWAKLSQYWCEKARNHIDVLLTSMSSPVELSIQTNDIQRQTNYFGFIEPFYCRWRSHIYFAVSVEQDKPLDTCSLILLHTLFYCIIMSTKLALCHLTFYSMCVLSPTI